MRRPLALLAVLAVVGPAARGQTTYTWNGGGTDNNWTTAANWAGSVVPLSSIDTTVQFAGTTRLTPNQNITTGNTAFALNRLFFDSTAGAFVLGGAPLQLQTSTAGVAPRLTTDTASAVTVNNNLVLANTLTLDGTGTGTLSINNTISGAGGITMSRTGATAVLDNGNQNFAASSYTGATEVQAGTLQLRSSRAYGNTSGVTVAAGSALSLSTGTGGESQFNKSLTLSGAGVSGSGAAGSGALRAEFGNSAWTGPITLAADATVVNAVTSSNNGYLSLSGVIGESGGSRALYLTASGGANTYIGGTNTFSGGLVLSGTANRTFYLRSDAALGTGTLQINDGIQVSSDTGARTFANAVRFQSFRVNGGSLLTFNGPAFIDGGGSNNVTRSIGGGNLTFAAGVGQANGTGLGLTTFGNGTTYTLGGTSSFDGPFNVFDGLVVLSAGATLNGTGSVIVNAGGSAPNFINNGTLNRPVTVIGAGSGVSGRFDSGGTLTFPVTLQAGGQFFTGAGGVTLDTTLTAVGGGGSLNGGTFTVNGATTGVGNSTLTIAAGATLAGSGGVTVGAGGTLNVNGTDNQAVTLGVGASIRTFSNATAGVQNGPVTVPATNDSSRGSIGPQSGGVLTLNGSLTTGAGSGLNLFNTTVNAQTTVAGYLNVTGTVGGTGSTAITSGGTLGLAGTLNQNVTATGGTITLGQNGSGTPTVGGNVVLNASQVQVNAQGASIVVTGTLTTTGTSTIGSVPANDSPLTVSGLTTVQSGTLTIKGDRLIGPGAVELLPGASLVVNGSGGFSKALLVRGSYTSGGTASNGVTLDGGTLTPSGTMTLASTLTVQGTGGTLSAGTVNVAGATTVTAGTFTVPAGTTLGGAGALGVSGGAFAVVNGTVNKAVTANGALTGNATVNGTLSVPAGGAVGPGNSPGTLISRDGVTIGGQYDWDLNANTSSPAQAGTAFDRLRVTGANATVTVGGGQARLSIHLLAGVNLNDPFWASPHSWAVIELTGNTSTPSGNFDFLDNASYAQGTFTTAAVPGALLLNFTPVPEPAGVLAAAGLGLLAARRVRTRRGRVV